MKVLVIDDHPTDQKLALRVLSEAGFSVTVADAWDEAQVSIQNDRPEVILLDMSLPGEDGIHVVRYLKANPQTRDIRVVALTCFPERYPMSKAIAAGCDGYLVKPISTRTLPNELASFAISTRGREVEE